MSDTPHELINPDRMPPPRGFTHVVAPAAGRTLHIAGQTAHDEAGGLPGETFLEQFRFACENVRRAVHGAGGRSSDLVSMRLFTTDIRRYRAEQEEIGAIWRETFGRHYPAMAVLEVSGLVDPRAVVELTAVAVVPEERFGAG